METVYLHGMVVLAGLPGSTMLQEITLKMSSVLKPAGSRQLLYNHHDTSISRIDLFHVSHTEYLPPPRSIHPGSLFLPNRMTSHDRESPTSINPTLHTLHTYLLDIYPLNCWLPLHRGNRLLRAEGSILRTPPRKSSGFDTFAAMEISRSTIPTER